MVVYRFKNMASTWLPVSLLMCSLIYGGILVGTYSGTAWPLSSSSSTTASGTATQKGGSQTGDTATGNAGEGIKAASNSTLGFGEIFFISMPERSDRHDAMALLASYTNLTLTYEPGVNGSEVPNKAKPFKANVRAAELGSWRAHANVWRTFLERRLYDTVLILEDDLDWDVNIGAIMERIAQHTPAAASTPPYGHETWDVYWFGACLHGHNKSKTAPEQFSDIQAARFDDPLGPNAAQLRDYDRKYFAKHTAGGPYKDSGERVIHQAYEPICTMAYAITRRGAQRLLYNAGYRRLDGPVDIAMAMAARDGRLKGWVVWPPAITAWRIGGGRDSDIQKIPQGEGRGNDGGWSHVLRNSARRAMASEFSGPSKLVRNP